VNSSGRYVPQPMLRCLGCNSLFTAWYTHHVPISRTIRSVKYKNDGICILRFPYSCFLVQIPQFSSPVLSPSPSPSGPRVNPISWWTVKVRTQFTQPPRYITRNRSITTSKSSVMAAHHCTTKKTNPSMSHSELPKN
jgi:hypothetical protein